MIDEMPRWDVCLEAIGGDGRRFFHVTVEAPDRATAELAAGSEDPNPHTETPADAEIRHLIGPDDEVDGPTP